MNQSTSIKELATALKGFQAEVANVPKEGTNPFYKSKYATLEAVIDTAKPTLAKHGLSFAQFPSFEGLTTILMHTSGEWISSDAKIVMKDQTPQGQGSAITYMRRYALSAILGLATEDDDDGQVASTPAKAPAKVVAKPAPKSDVQSKKSEIKKLADSMVLVPLEGAEEYRTHVFEQTGLDLVESNYGEIITRLKALQ